MKRLKGLRECFGAELAMTTGQILARTLIGRTGLQMQILPTLLVGQVAINARVSEVEEILQVEEVHADGPILTPRDDLRPIRTQCDTVEGPNRDGRDPEQRSCGKWVPHMSPIRSGTTGGSTRTSRTCPRKR